MHHLPRLAVLLLVTAGATAQARWSSLDPLPARRSAAVIFDPLLGSVMLFSGSNASFVPFQDHWTWDGVRFTQLHPAQLPPARSHAAVAFDSSRQRIVLFGGAMATGN